MKKEDTIYILPNLITTMNIFFGFFSIIRSINGDFVMAAYAIIAAAIFDLLDGRVARITRTTSQFGKHYDSLCDLTSFGLAPGLLTFLWALQPYGRLGWLVSFFYLACGAVRLASFNAISEEKENDSKGYFIGLPSPMAAGIIASGVLTFHEMNWLAYHNIFVLILTFALGFSMVASFPYRSFKDFDFRKKLPFHHLILGIFILSVIAFRPHITLFILFLTYATLGLVFGIINWRKRRSHV